MNNRFSKLISIVLSLAMLVSMCGVTTFADETKAVADEIAYYVQYGATGDGSSAESPSGDLEAVINDIGSKYALGDNVTVYVMNCGKEPTAEKPLTVDGEIPYLTWYSKSAANTATHKATVTYKTYDAANQPAKACFRFSGGFKSNDKYGDNECLGGPTVFDGVDFIVGRIAGGDRLFTACEYDVVFKNSTIRTAVDLDGTSLDCASGDKITVFPYTDENGALKTRKDHYLTFTQTGGTENATSATDKLGENYDSSLTVDSIDTLHVSRFYLIGNYLAGNDYNIEGNATIRLGAGTLSQFRFGSNNENIIPVAKKNISIILDGTNVSSILTGAGKLTVEGNLQIIKRAGTKFDVTSDHVNAAHMWVINSEYSDTDITETPGTFYAGNVLVSYAVGNGIVYYGDNYITLPEGEWNIKGAGNVDAIIKHICPTVAATAPAGYIVDGWKDNGDGTITPNFVKKPALEYFVQWTTLSERDGSAEKPFKNIAEAVSSAIDAGYGKGDTVIVKVRNDATQFTSVEGKAHSDKFWAYNAAGDYILGTAPEVFFGSGNGTVESRMTYWANTSGAGTMVTSPHEFELVVEGTGVGKNDAYLAQSTFIGKNTQVILCGPTTFRNIKLVTNRNCDREWCLNGYDATFENVLFTHFNAAQYGGTYGGMNDVTNIESEYWAAIPLDVGPTPSSGVTNAAPGGTVKFVNTEFGNTGSTGGAHVGIFVSTQPTTYVSPVKVIVENCDPGKMIHFNWGNRYSPANNTYFNKGLTVIADNSWLNGVKDYNNSGDALGDTIITGGLTLISMNGGTVPAVVDEVTYDAIYTVVVDKGAKLDSTDTPGVIDIVSGVVYTVSDDGKTIYYNDDTVTVKNGETLTLNGAESVSALMEMFPVPTPAPGKINGRWVDNGDGTITPVYDDKVITPVYVKFGGNANASGTKNDPFGSVYQAVNYLNKQGYVAGEEVTVYILEDVIPEDKIYTDDSGVKHTEFWKYDSNYNFIYNKSNSYIDANGKNVVSRFTPWVATETEKPGQGLLPSYPYTLVVKGEDPAKPAFLAQCDRIGENYYLVLGGPTKFENIRYFTNRSMDRELVTLGYEAWFKNVSFYYCSTQRYDAGGVGGTWTGPVPGHSLISLDHPDFKDKVINNASALHFEDCSFNAQNDAAFYGIHLGRRNNLTVNAPFVVELKNCDTVPFAFGSHVGTAFNAGITILADNTNVAFNQYGTNTCTISDLLIVTKNGATAGELPSVVSCDNVYKYTVATANNIEKTETTGTFMTDAADKHYVIYDADFNARFGKVSEDGTIALPKGEWFVDFSETSFAENDFAGIRALAAEGMGCGNAYAARLTWKDADGDGLYAPESEKFSITIKHIGGRRTEYNSFVEGTKVYSFEKTTKFGNTVSKISRTENTGTAKQVWPNYAIDIKEEIADETVYLSDVKYITMWYYYESSLDTPTFSGVQPIWTVGYPYDTVNKKQDTSAWEIINAQKADQAIEANKWTAVVFDLSKNGNYISQYLPRAYQDMAMYQQRIYPLGQTGSKLLADGESFYVGDIIFTNYDPTEEIRNNPGMIFVSENGNDANSGLSDVSPVKTVGRVYEILKDADKDVVVSVSGTVEAGNIANANENITVTFVGSGENAKLSSFVTGSNVKFENITIESLTVAYGFAVDLDMSIPSVTIEDGTLNLEGGNVTNLTLAPAGGDVILNHVSGSYGNLTLAEGAYAENVQMLLTYGAEVPSAIEKLSASGKKIIVKLPQMKSAKGIVFEVLPGEELGEFRTYSGNKINYGYGNTTYICWGVNPSGTKAYYSNTATGFTLRIPESGTYRLNVAGEADYTASNGKQIKGFSSHTHLTLPEGYLGWINDNKGTMSVTTAAAAAITQYVSNKNGNDDNDGLTAETPVKTIKQALLNIGSRADGHVYIMDTVSDSTWYIRSSSDPYKYAGNQDILLYNVALNAIPLKHTGTITYEGMTQDSALMYGPHGLDLGGPSVFKNLTLLEGYNVHKTFSTNGHNVEFDNVTYYNMVGPFEKDSESWNTPNQHSAATAIRQVNLGYTSADDGTDGRIVVKNFSTAGGSEIGELFIGTSDAGDKLGNQTVELAGGKIDKIHMFYNLASVDVLSFVYNAGSVGQLVASSGSTTISALQIVNNNGNTFPAIPTSTKGGSVKETWIMNSAQGAGGTLDVTETAGQFKVLGDKIAKAQNASGAVVFSANSILTVPADTWNVTYVDAAPYGFNGTVITANETIEIDLSKMVPSTPANKAFIGWADAKGEYFASSVITLNAGETANAKFVDFDTALMGDMSVLGVQIRLAAGDITQGLRFVTEVKKPLLSSLGITEIGGQNVKYGTLVLPADLHSDPITLNTELVAKVPAQRTYRQNDDMVRYTAVLVDMSTENYNRVYDARPYIEYTDKNGTARVIYGETYGTSLYKAADYAYRFDGSLSETAKSALDKMIKEAIPVIDKPVAMRSFTGNGTYTDIPKSYEEATEENFFKGEVFYTVPSGLEVREIRLKGGKGTTESPATAATIGILTDTHVNLINEKDEYDPELQYTWQTRPGWRGEANLQSVRNAMSFAGMYDLVAVTGDIIDYLSYGALDFVKEVMLDAYPNGLYTMGGHDITKQMETNMNDETPEEERFEMLYEYYGTPGNTNHDIHYQERLINNNVLCINLNNGTNFRYRWDVEMEVRLADAIKRARENGWIILLFQHEPTGTYDSADKAVIPYDYKGGVSTDAVGPDNYFFTNNGDGVTPRVHNSYNDNTTPNDTPLKVYNLIRSNPDIVRGIFTGHHHQAVYLEIIALDENGDPYKPTAEEIEAKDLTVDENGYAIIPQYVNRATSHNGAYGVVTKVVVTPAE